MHAPTSSSIAPKKPLTPHTPQLSYWNFRAIWYENTMCDPGRGLVRGAAMCFYHPLCWTHSLEPSIEEAYPLFLVSLGDRVDRRISEHSLGDLNLAEPMGRDSRIVLGHVSSRLFEARGMKTLNDVDRIGVADLADRLYVQQFGDTQRIV